VTLLDQIQDIDEQLLRALNIAGENPLLDGVLVFLTVLGISYVIVLASVPLWWKGRRDLGYDVVVLVIVASLFTEVIKLLIDRPRPFEELPDVSTIVSASGPSFPSAHASRAFAVAAIVAIRTSHRYGATSLAIASLISLSRVCLGVHWPTDVLAGALLGAALAVVFNCVAKEYTPYKSLRARVIRAFSQKARLGTIHQSHCR